MPILKLSKHDPQKELEFEVRCALEEDPSKRLDEWLEWNLKMRQWVEELRGSKESHQRTKQE